MNVFLWTGYAEANDTLYAGLYSVFDDDQEIDFQSVPQNGELLQPYQHQLPVERLIWFSRGYYAAEKKSEGLIIHDLRFGRSDLWLSDQPAPFVWNYKLIFNSDSTEVTGFKQYEPSFDMRAEMWDQLLNRVLGN
jgi:inner membrane protein